MSWTGVAGVASLLEVGRGDELSFSFLTLFLSVAGEVPPRSLPDLPLEVALIPGLDRVIERRIHAGNIVSLFSLAAAIDARRKGSPGMWVAMRRAVARERGRL